MTGLPSLTIVIPTYGRDEVLVQTVDALLRLDVPADRLRVIDQTPEHDVAAERQWREWHQQQAIDWVRRKEPSITEAMNAGLSLATTDAVLFLDDDIRPAAGLVASHRRCLQAHSDAWASVGQVIQPWQQPEPLAAPRRQQGLRVDHDFPFHSLLPDEVQNVMAGNLCVRRQRALAIGGFDQNFKGVAYRFETDFARRLVAAGGRIRFCPEARIDHLRVERGGTRQSGNHLASADPIHGVGDYYYAMRHGGRWQATGYIMKRFVREVCTKFHLRHPWWIPVKCVGEVRACWWAARLVRQGPSLLKGESYDRDL